MEFTRHEKRIINIISKYEEYIKKNHASKGRYFDFIFLCGAIEKPNDNRSRISKIIDSSKNVKTVYSEKLFKYLDTMDLLTFEELLLDISTYVVIIVESWGSACELGAFSFVNKHIDKLIVINDKKYEFERSFITDGPIKKINEYKPEIKKVFYEKFNNQGNENILMPSDELIHKLKNIKKLDTLKSKPFKIDEQDNTLKIKDVRYLLWLILDLIKTFGTFRKNNEYNIVKAIFKVDNIIIYTHSNNEINNQNQVKDIFSFLVDVLVNFKFIVIDKNNYKINYEHFAENKIELNRFANLLFNESFVNTLEWVNERFKILNSLKKEGDNIWLIS